ncbi:hypothetical protein [Kutzneria kofuensis]|uniref:hypothetical protein n=1 Tax=Kutzneria kofuensis TaxID=103725 RepID=UPI0031ECA870
MVHAEPLPFPAGTLAVHRNPAHPLELGINLATPVVSFDLLRWAWRRQAVLLAW